MAYSLGVTPNRFHHENDVFFAHNTRRLMHKNGDTTRLEPPKYSMASAAANSYIPMMPMAETLHGQNTKDATSFTEDIVVLGARMQMSLDDFALHPATQCLHVVLPAVLLKAAQSTGLATATSDTTATVEADGGEETNHLLSAGVFEVHTIELQQVDLGNIFEKDSGGHLSFLITFKKCLAMWEKTYDTMLLCTLQNDKSCM